MTIFLKLFLNCTGFLYPIELNLSIVYWFLKSFIVIFKLRLIWIPWFNSTILPEIFVLQMIKLSFVILGPNLLMVLLLSLSLHRSPGTPFPLIFVIPHPLILSKNTSKHISLLVLLIVNVVLFITFIFVHLLIICSYCTAHWNVLHNFALNKLYIIIILLSLS